MIFFTVKCTFPSTNGKVHTRSPLPHSGVRSRTRLPAERTIAAAQPRPFFVNLCVTVTGGMIPCIDIHTHRTAPDTPERRALRTFRLGSEGALPDRPLACGLHPWDAGRPDAEQLVERLAAMPCDAIGEIGLDYVRTDRHDPRPVQLFDTQLAMAASRRLPVVLHCVRAFEAILTQLDRYPAVTAIFHGFIGSPQQAERAVRDGHYLSFGPASFRSPRSVEAMRRIPAERLFLETDETEQPIEAVYDEAARLLDRPTERLKQTLYDNFMTLFPNL